MMFGRWRRRAREGDAAADVYRRIVAQARQPAFFADLGVPDNLDGRFEMLALHLSLVLKRLRGERDDPACAALAQALTDHMAADMDANLREMGAGDLGVGRRVKRMAGALYGRYGAYEAGLAGGDTAMRQAVRRNLFATVEPTDGQVAAMARYALAVHERLARFASAELAQGVLAFPPPAPEEPAGKR